MRAVDGFHGPTVARVAPQLLALLVPRPGDLRLAKWMECDPDAAIWSIPPDRMRMRRAQRVPLPAGGHSVDGVASFGLLGQIRPSLAGIIDPPDERKHHEHRAATGGHRCRRNDLARPPSNSFDSGQRKRPLAPRRQTACACPSGRQRRAQRLRATAAAEYRERMTARLEYNYNRSAP